MATKFYFHLAAQTNPGTLPASNVSISATTPSQIADGTNRSMDTTIGAGQNSISLTSLANQSAQPSLIGRFISRPVAAQTISGTFPALSLHIGGSQTNGASNFIVTAVVGLWRPSTGSTVSLQDDLTTLHTSEPTTSETALSAQSSLAANSITSQDQDVLVVEIWRDSTAQTMSTAYGNTIYFDGTTEDSTTTNAAYITLLNTTLKFAPQSYGQAQAKIKAFGVNQSAQAQAKVGRGYGWGQANALIPGIYTYVEDNFNRTLVDQLGTASTSGGDYTLVLGTASNFDVNGSQATIVVSNTTSQRMSLEQAYITPGAAVKFKVASSATPINASIFVKINWGLGSADDSDPLAGYQLGVAFSITGTIAPVRGLNSVSGGTATAYVNGDLWQFEGLIVESSNNLSRVRYRVYKVGDPEPAWQITNISGIDPIPGHVGLTETVSSFTGSPITITLDDLKVEAAGWTESGQAQATISAGATITQVFAQAQAKIKTTRVFGQAQADVKAISRGFGQAQAKLGANTVFAQAQARSLKTWDNTLTDLSPTSWWKMGNSSGNFLDSIGTLHLVPSGTPTRGIKNYRIKVDEGAAQFATSSDFASVADNAALDLGDTNWTIGLWARRLTDTAGYEIMLSKGLNAYNLGVNPSDTFFLYKAGTGAIRTSDYAVPADGTWHFYVVTRTSASNTHIYVDGVETGYTFSDTTTTFADNASALHVAHDVRGSDPSFSGGLDEIFIIKGTVLTDTQISDLYMSRIIGGPDRIAYISTTGNDTTGDGSLSLPWFHIPRAIKSVCPGDEIQCRGGTYSTTTAIIANTGGSPIAPIKVNPYPNEKPIFSGSNTEAAFLSIQDSSWIRVQDIFVQNYKVNQSGVLYIVGDSEGLLFRNITITGTSGTNAGVTDHQIYISGGVSIGTSPRNILVENCWLEGVSGASAINGAGLHIYSDTGGGIPYSGRRITYRNNIVINADFGAVLWGRIDSVQMTHNTFVNVDTGLNVHNNEVTNVLFRDNLILGNSTAPLVELTGTLATITEDYNFLSQGGTYATTIYFIEPGAVNQTDWIAANGNGVHDIIPGSRTDSDFDAGWYPKSGTAVGAASDGFDMGRLNFNKSFAQAQAKISAGAVSVNVNAQSQGWVKATAQKAYSQAQADIKAVSRGFAQAQTDIKAITNAFAQAQTDIKATSQAFAQVQTDIKAIGRGFAQANTDIKNQATKYTNPYAQAQTDIEATSRGYAQAQVDIKATSQAYSQSQADIKATTNVSAQANADIKAISRSFAQANADIEATSQIYGQAQSDIKVTTKQFAQAQAQLIKTAQLFSQAQADIKVTTTAYAQAQAAIKTIGRGFSQAQADILVLNNNSFGQAQATIKTVGRGFAQANSDIKAISQGFGQANADIKATSRGYAQAQSDIKVTSSVFAQAQACIKGTAFAQAQADIKAISKVFAQSQADIKTTNYSFAQANADIKTTSYGFAQANSNIKVTNIVCAQSQAYIKQIYQQFAQSQTDIKQIYQQYAQAQTDIKAVSNSFAQAQACIKGNAFAQAQADIKVISQSYAQAQATIQIIGTGFAQANSDIKTTSNTFAQAQATINVTTNNFAQANALIYIPQIARPVADISNTGWIGLVI